MKILKIEMSNYKKIKALEIEPNGESFVVAGEPDAGKTTVISALWDLLQPISEPLKHGEKSGKIRITLGKDNSEYRIFAERKFTEKTNTISILSSKGEKITKAIIVDLLNKITYEPLKILDMKGKELTDYLLDVAIMPEGFDLHEIEQKRIILESERLDAHRDKDILKKRLGDEPEKVTEIINTEDIHKKLEGIVEHNSEIEKAEIGVNNLIEERSIKTKRTEEIQAQIDALNIELSNTHDDIIKIGTRIAKGEAWLEENEKRDYTKIKAELDAAEENNKKVEAYDKWLSEQTLYTTAKEKHAEIDTYIKQLDQDKKDGLSKAKFPVDGLTIEDGKVFYQDCLLENCGTEKQIYVSTALVASNIKGIKAMRIDRAESMGKAARQMVIDTAKKFGVQVCMSRVAEESIGDNEIHIIDGNLQ